MAQTPKPGLSEIKFETKLSMRIEAYKMYIDICKHYTTLIAGLIVVLVSVFQIFSFSLDNYKLFLASLIFLGLALACLLVAIYFGSMCIENLGKSGNAGKRTSYFFDFIVVLGSGLFLAGIASLVLYTVTGDLKTP